MNKNILAIRTLYLSRPRPESNWPPKGMSQTQIGKRYIYRTIYAFLTDRYRRRQFEILSLGGNPSRPRGVRLAFGHECGEKQDKRPFLSIAQGPSVFSRFLVLDHCHGHQRPAQCKTQPASRQHSQRQHFFGNLDPMQTIHRGYLHPARPPSLHRKHYHQPTRHQLNSDCYPKRCLYLRSQRTSGEPAYLHPGPSNQDYQ